MTSITTKFQSYVLSITTLIVFTIWFKYSVNFQINPYLKVISSSIFSLGLYRLVATSLLFLFKKLRFIRKFFLGPKYLEGTWVGFYYGINGEEKFIIERFEQDFETLIIRGVSYNKNKKFHTSWISFPANIDLLRGELTYMYELKGINEISNGTGIVFFNFHRENQEEAPNMLKGFSADLHNSGRRAKSLEYKISHDHDITDADALVMAIDFYNKNKDNF